ncbi:carboxy terminal-processing peptidase [Gammaproteobacteria bacterium]|nr:carboxy terminal-processing peptidase [Gammaproteobacteria bacterium]MDB9859549.1 carboxy terminal-processing peptidase [Gammaproteobacteria bacterium]MDB9940072.1 carboxy terminal-processing peptidase [Gammaproteobacteria bacterium]
MLKNIQIIAIILSICVSCSSEPEINIKASIGKYNLANEINAKIGEEHFFQHQAIKNINPRLGKALIKQLDSQKIYFTKDEILYFTNKFQSSGNDVEIATSYELINLYFNRLIEATKYQIKVIQKKDFNFSKDENILIDNDLQEFRETNIDLREIWAKLAKNDVLTSMLTEKNEYEAIELISKRYKNRLRRISQRNEEDIFSIVMNNLTGLFDPHSSYMSPKSAEDFEMTMSLNLEGIGALLTTEDDYPIIVSVVPGGPAEKSGKINPDDKIVKVRQIQKVEVDSVDVVGWRIDEVVQLIRGEAGTQLELEIIPAKTEDLSDRKWVLLTREEVKLEEQAAKSLIIDSAHGGENFKIGIIDLPAFYIDFNAWRDRDPDFRSSSKDVENILNQFKLANVDAVIVDLRGNSGGSLYEANKLTGLFVSSGPTVQVKESNGDIRPWGDARANQVWKKPMAVMVDRYSASASEIFAGAIQDYQRGLIIGHKTFGKGTVQQLDDLTSGQLKLTESKFYRVTGSGMQNRGVEPDITLPSTWDIEESGESSLDSALPWDQISPTPFRKFKLNKNALDSLKIAHEKRMLESPDLQYILNIRKRYDEQQGKKSISINLDTRKAEKIDRQLWVLATENQRRAAQNLETFKTFESLEEFNENKEDNDLDIDIDLKNDYLLNEGMLILSDYLYLNTNLLLSEAA